MNLTTTNKRKPGINKNTDNKRRSFFHNASILTLIIIFVWWGSLSTFFAQDDFTHLLISSAKNFKEFLLFFKPISGVIFFRPLSVQISTWLIKAFFGLNPFAFHSIGLLFHLVNSWLVYLLLKKLTEKNILSYFGALFYAVHPSHFLSLYWMSEFSMVLAPFFAFWAILAFLEGKKSLFWILMVMATLSNELALTVPLILTIWIYLSKSNRISKFSTLIPAYLLAVIIYWLRFVLYPTSLGSEYELNFSFLNIAKNIKWHFIRGMGIPEGFRGFLANTEVRVALLLLLIFWILVVFEKKKIISARGKKFTMFGFLWFIAAISPMILLAHHQSPIYHIIGIPGFYLGIVYLFNIDSENKSLLLLLIGLFLASSFWSVMFLKKTHWVTKRAKVAEYHLSKIKLRGIKNNFIFIDNDQTSAKEVYFSLGAGDALKVYFGKKVKFYFEGVGGEGIISNPNYVLTNVDASGTDIKTKGIYKIPQ